MAQSAVVAFHCKGLRFRSDVFFPGDEVGIHFPAVGRHESNVFVRRDGAQFCPRAGASVADDEIDEFFPQPVDGDPYPAAFFFKRT